MSVECYYLEDLSTTKLKSLLEQIGGTASLKSGDASRLTGRSVGKVVGDSIRSRIAAKLIELQGKYGDILTPKNSLIPGPAREEYIEWYLEQRAPDIAAGKKTVDFYKSWSMVHLADTLKYRRETLA